MFKDRQVISHKEQIHKLPELTILANRYVPEDRVIHRVVGIKFQVQTLLQLIVVEYLQLLNNTHR